jgi:streptogramin lyase
MVPSADGFLGKVVGGYTLTQLLGSGGAGSVYLGVKDGAEGAPQEQVAIKLLIPAAQATAADRAEFRERFRREAKALERLQHPHILGLLAYGEDEALGLPYMVLPYMQGGTLATRVAAGPLPLAEVARYGEQLAAALDYAHGQGIVHRDVKPANVLLDAAGQPFLADFGIAKIFDPAGTTLVTITGTGQVMGTADYMSPEQAKGEDVGPEADVYSLGMVLYHLVTGRVPFEGKSLTHVLLQIAQEPPTPPRRLRPDLPPPAEAALLRALAKKPADRFQTPGELAAAFALGVKGEWAPGLQAAATLAEYVPQPTAVAPAPDRAAPTARRGRAGLLIAGVAALLLLAITGTLFITGALPPKSGTSTPLASGGTATSTSAATGTTAATASATRGQPTATATQGGGGGGGGGTSPTPTFTATATATSSTAGKMREFNLPANRHPQFITGGSDGALWFTESQENNIGRITTSGGYSEFLVPTAGGFPSGITNGADGALWFTESSANKIGRITTGGSFSEFPIPTANSQPEDITSGPDSALWFTEYNANKIGRVTTGGSFSEFPTVNCGVASITSGPDGALWFAESCVPSHIGRLTTGGSLREFSIPTAGSSSDGITNGPDGALWFTEPNGDKIGRVTT